MGRGPAFTDEEDAIVRSSMTAAAVGLQIGRSTKAVRARRAALRLYEKPKAAQAPQRRGRVQIVDPPSPHVFDERDVRNEIPHRSLTHAFFNDPKPGYSALEQRVDNEGVDNG